ncbi:cellular tumor antigen p53 isoform X2 [Nematostella vectensis]|uniref:Transcription factor p63 n=1 Tax=Nematostella vectensis TaxID=45351 RepID=A8DPD6_NEMVE|nr:cellular tumor antigen p53 isoform X2 [Nematostella vectensis]XP_032238615.1 cellular tumor antigen p53 isoform X2 [Nematostella vectensis]ABF72158.1 transcription factor p63 [Nematostella vectensis]DAA06085.1 TPA_exp: transcription factor p63 [Nematostella vectensis]
MSQSSSQESQILSQGTYEVLRSFVAEAEGAEYQYNVAPYSVDLTSCNEQENLEINIEKVALIPSDFLDYQGVNGFHTEPVESSREQYHHHVPSAITPPPDYPTTNLVPANTDFPGEYGFDVGFDKENGPTPKSAPWTYSHQLQKLLCRMKCLVPVRLVFRSKVPPEGFYIRAVVVYKQPEHFREVVERCANHITRQDDGHTAPKHLLRCENTKTLYRTCNLTGRHELMFPTRKPDAGMDYFKDMFQFMCFNSCPGGLNRRPIIVIFTLELSGVVYGRKVLDVRVCACPGRDKADQESLETRKKNKMKNLNTPPPTPDENKPSTSGETPAGSHNGVKEELESSHKSSSDKRDIRQCTKKGFELEHISKRIKREKEDEEEFTITVRGRDNYEMLLKIKESLDLMNMVPQSVVDNYRKTCPPCGPTWFLDQQKPKPIQQVESSTDSELECSPPNSLSQLSRTSSNASSQGRRAAAEYSAVRFSLKRTVTYPPSRH